MMTSKEHPIDGAQTLPAAIELQDGRPGGDTGESLGQAATIATAQGVPLDNFMQMAFAAYLDANPEVREQIEHSHAVAHLEEMRKRGLVPMV